MTEQTLHRQVVTYLKLQYPNLVFHTDFAAGSRMTIGQAKKNKALQSCSGWPDLFIAEPANGFNGLFLEIKTDLAKVFKKDGTLKSGDHIANQAAMITRLNTKGYKAAFGCGFEGCKKIIDEYLNAA